jgi:hypothetical protein
MLNIVWFLTGIWYKVTRRSCSWPTAGCRILLFFYLNVKFDCWDRNGVLSNCNELVQELNLCYKSGYFLSHNRGVMWGPNLGLFGWWPGLLWENRLIPSPSGPVSIFGYEFCFFRCRNNKIQGSVTGIDAYALKRITKININVTFRCFGTCT